MSPSIRLGRCLSLVSSLLGPDHVSLIPGMCRTHVGTQEMLLQVRYTTNSEQQLNNVVLSFPRVGGSEGEDHLQKPEYTGERGGAVKCRVWFGFTVFRWLALLY